MRTVMIIMPLTFALTFITGMLGIMDAAYILLAIGVGMLIGYLMLSTIVDYIIPVEEDNLSSYNNNYSSEKLAM